MSQRLKSKYRVTYYGPKGTPVDVDVEADSIGLIDGVEDSLMTWSKRNKPVFSISFRSFISSTLVTANKLQGI